MVETRLTEGKRVDCRPSMEHKTDSDTQAARRDRGGFRDKSWGYIIPSKAYNLHWRRISLPGLRR